MMSKPYLDISGYISKSKNWPDLPFKQVEEGKLKFRIPDSASIYDAPAFFNPEMALNRDLAILFTVIYSKIFGKKLRVFEPLAGIGIRGLRLAKEIPEHVDEVVINDFSEVSTQIAAFNLHLSGQEEVFIFKREARSIAYELGEHLMKFQFIDLDPFGSPSPFIDSIWFPLSSRGIVAVTATDMTALCGVYPKACKRKYGGIPLNNYHTHETAARLLISLVVHSAARHERGAIPVFTASVNHYTKVFFDVNRGRGAANKAMDMIGYSYTCDNCFTINYTEGDPDYNYECCGSIKRAGPLWTGNLFDRTIAEEALSLMVDENHETGLEAELQHLELPSVKKITKIFTEAKNGHDLKGYYSMDILTKKLKITQPKIAIFRDELEKQGYRYVETHFRKQSFRSDAPSEVIFKTIRKLVKE